MPPQTWEYLTIKAHPEWGFFVGRKLDGEMLNEHLNDLGAEGWELVSSFDVNAHRGQSQEFILIFKRPRA